MFLLKYFCHLEIIVLCLLLLLFLNNIYITLDGSYKFLRYTIISLNGDKISVNNNLFDYSWLHFVSLICYLNEDIHKYFRCPQFFYLLWKLLNWVLAQCIIFTLRPYNKRHKCTFVYFSSISPTLSYEISTNKFRLHNISLRLLSHVNFAFSVIGRSVASY